MNTTITPLLKEEFGRDGERLKIHYSFFNTPFGQLFNASTEKGLCYSGFTEINEIPVEVKVLYPAAIFIEENTGYEQVFQELFNGNNINEMILPLHLKGSDFQLNVWKKLIDIPFGTTASYKDIATEIGNPKACRAVGSAVGSNPVSIIIPCHRVILSSGNTGQYHWGEKRKIALLDWEKACLSKYNSCE